MPVTKNPRLTYYEVLKKDEDGWEVFIDSRCLGLHETLDGAMSVAKELEADGHMAMVRPVYVSWYRAIAYRGRAVYTTGKERKKNGKVQKA